MKSNKPEVFYLKIKNKKEIKYEFQEDKVLEYIKKYNVHDEFIIIIFIGRSQYGKSKLAEILTGVKHEIGELLQSETEGATIAYGGTIKDIYTRIHLEPPEYKTQDIDVFFIDTEGIFDDSSKSFIAPFLMPLLLLSTKIVTFMGIYPDDSISNYLSLCKSFIISNDYGKSKDPFNDKLIVRIKDFPQVIEKDEIYFYTEDFKINSQIAKNFKDQSIFPIYTLGGPYDQQNQSHDKKYTKYFLDKIFDSFINQEENNNQIIYSSPEKLIKDIHNLNLQKDEYQVIMKLFKEKSTSERILYNSCYEINEKIDLFIQEKLRKMEYNDYSFNQFFLENIESEIKDICAKHNIEDVYYYEYYNLEKKNI